MSATVNAGHSESVEHDGAVGSEDWSLRPWLMAGLLAMTGVLFGVLVDQQDYAQPLPSWRQVTATFLLVAGVGFALVATRTRLVWAVVFALSAGAVLAGVGYAALRYDAASPTLTEWPFLCAVFAAVLAAPLFQTARDEAAWRFPYPRLHGHVWGDAVIGAAGLAFVGLTFLVTVLLGALLDLIAIDFLQRALEEPWFGFALAGAAFGAATGIVRENEKLLGTLLRVVLLILSVLAPAFAAGLALFLLALPFTGLEPLWATDSATPIVLLCAAGAFVLLNAVIRGDAEERSPMRLLIGSALVLALCILPLAIIAAWSMGLRIGQHGWTPERLWGAVAVFVALAYGAAYLFAVMRGRWRFDSVARPLNTRLAIGTCVLALVLAMPVIDFGAISARSQLARLESGKVAADVFDFAALRWEFGAAGRRAHARLANSADPAIARAAAKALQDKRANRFQAPRVEPSQIIVQTRDPAMRARVVKNLATDGYRCADGCYAIDLGPAPGGQRFAIVGGSLTSTYVISPDGQFVPDRAREQAERETLYKLGDTVRIETVPRRMITVNGKPVGEPLD